jgi:hypothetical protein
VPLENAKSAGFPEPGPMEKITGAPEEQVAPNGTGARWVCGQGLSGGLVHVIVCGVLPPLEMVTGSDAAA